MKPLMMKTLALGFVVLVAGSARASTIEIGTSMAAPQAVDGPGTSGTRLSLRAGLDWIYADRLGVGAFVQRSEQRVVWTNEVRSLGAVGAGARLQWLMGETTGVVRPYAGLSLGRFALRNDTLSGVVRSAALQVQPEIGLAVRFGKKLVGRLAFAYERWYADDAVSLGDRWERSVDAIGLGAGLSLAL